MPFLNPETTLAFLDIIPGMRIADFGSGSGRWAVLLARAAGPSGRVFAFDVQESAVEATRAAARHAGITSVEAVRADIERPRATALEDATVDAVMISNMLFQADDKKAVVAEAARIVKPRGRIFLIDWDDTESLTGPPKAQHISRQTAEQMFSKMGFVFEKEFNAGSHHYGIIFRKQ